MTALSLALFYLAYASNVGFLVLYASTAKFWRNPLGRVLAFESLAIATVYTMSLVRILSGGPLNTTPASLAVNLLVTAMLVYRAATYAWVVRLACRAKRRNR